MVPRKGNFVPVLELEFPKLYRIYVVLILMLIGVLLCLSQIQWSPKYPVIAKVNLHPALVTIKAPEAGVVSYSKVQVGSLIRQQQFLLRIDKLNNRLFQNYYHQKKQRLDIACQKIKQEIVYQKQRLLKLKPLLIKKVLTEDFYHQQLTELRRLNLENKRLLDEKLSLQHRQWVNIQSPLAGKLFYIFVKSGEMVKKDAKLAILQPPHTTWQCHIELPSSYRKYLRPDALFRLSLPTLSKLKRYTVEAQLIQVLPMIKAGKKGETIEVMARISNIAHPDTIFLPNMTLSGYLLGKPQTIGSWIYHFIWSN